MGAGNRRDSALNPILLLPITWASLPLLTVERMAPVYWYYSDAIPKNMYTLGFNSIQADGPHLSSHTRAI